MKTFDRSGFRSDDLEFIHHRDILKFVLFQPAGPNITDVAFACNDVIDNYRGRFTSKNDFFKEFFVVVAAVLQFGHTRSIAVKRRLVVGHQDLAFHVFKLSDVLPVSSRKKDTRRPEIRFGFGCDHNRGQVSSAEGTHPIEETGAREKEVDFALFNGLL